MNKNTVWIEHSLGSFDFNKMVQLAPPEDKDTLPNVSKGFFNLVVVEIPPNRPSYLLKVPSVLPPLTE
jgi:hypothetical protein